MMQEYDGTCSMYVAFMFYMMYSTSCLVACLAKKNMMVHARTWIVFQ